MVIIVFKPYSSLSFFNFSRLFVLPAVGFIFRAPFTRLRLHCLHSRVPPLPLQADRFDSPLSARRSARNTASLLPTHPSVPPLISTSTLAYYDPHSRPGQSSRSATTTAGLVTSLSLSDLGGSVGEGSVGKSRDVSFDGLEDGQPPAVLDRQSARSKCCVAV